MDATSGDLLRLFHFMKARSYKNRIWKAVGRVELQNVVRMLFSSTTEKTAKSTNHRSGVMNSKYMLFLTKKPALREYQHLAKRWRDGVCRGSNGAGIHHPCRAHYGSPLLRTLIDFLSRAPYRRFSFGLRCPEHSPRASHLGK